jgi:hypothetical protein
MLMAAAPVLAACATLAAALLFSLWRRVPQSFQLAPPGAPALTRRASHTRAGVGGAAAVPSSFAWWPVLHSLFAWQGLMILAMFFSGTSPASIASSFFVVFMWLMARQRSRWLRALPINTRELLPTFVTPLLLVQVAGYYVDFFLPSHRSPLPELRVQAFELAVIVGWTLVVLLVSALYDWRWPRPISYWMRRAVLCLAALSGIGGMFLLFGPYKDTLVPDAIHHFARALPVGLPAVVVTAAPVLAALWWALDKVFREAEYADKPRVPQNEY